uniref:Uncharacterized protein n=1 Tax=Setaria italica TaxID=4555 RepID=K4A3S2_SETIT
MGDPKPQPALKNTQSSRARSCCRKLKACCCEHKLLPPMNKSSCRPPGYQITEIKQRPDDALDAQPTVGPDAYGHTSMC